MAWEGAAMRAVLLAAVMAGAACAAAPKAVPTPGQRKLLVERNQLWKAGHEAWKGGKRGDAIALLEKTLAIDLRVLGPWHGRTEMAAARLAHWHQARGEWVEEARHREAVIEARRRLYGEGNWRTVDARLELAEALAQPRRTAAQRDALKKARELGSRALGLGSEGKAVVALPLAREELKLREVVLGTKHPHYASSLHNLAVLHRVMGDHKAALPLLNEALKLREAALGRSHPEYARTLNSLAVLYNTLGDHEAALPLYKEALDVYEAALGRKHPHYANSLSNLAWLHRDMGNHKAALPLLKEALEVYETDLGRRDPYYAHSLCNLAALHRAMGNHKAALPLYKEALDVYEATLGRRHPQYARGLNDLAALHRAMGDHKAALPPYKEALEVAKATLGEKHPDYATGLSNLALLHRDMGDHAAAVRLSEQALAIVEGHLRGNAAVLSDRQQLAAASAVRVFLDNRLTLPDPEGALSAATHVLAWKGSVLLRQQHRRLFLRLSANPDARKAADRLQAATRDLAALRHSPKATKADLERLEKEREDAQAALAALSRAFREQRERGRPSPKALADALPEGAALVDYLFHGQHLTAFVHRKGRPAARVSLGRAGPVLSAVRAWRPLLEGGKHGGMPAVAMRRLLWLPLERHLEGAKVVLVSPDGVLGTVPFAALPGRKAGSYLIEDVALAVVPVPSAILEMLKPVDKAARLKPSLLVAGDLRYDPDVGVAAPPAAEDTRSAPRTGRERFTRLPATRAEMLAVEASFKELFKDGTTTALKKGEATKAAVRKALASVRYAHLATHGYFAPETVKSALAHDGKERLGERREVTGWHPLLLSGLALSDANRNPKTGEEDGILTALEVSEMDLTRLELAVLSACETGLGKVAGGEGILGMQRAFQIAGARSVIASLWKVDDRATQQLMADFYAAAWDTKKIVSRAEALRQAQLSMLREGRRRGVRKDAEKIDAGGTRLPPYYWAAFVLSGDWR